MRGNPFISVPRSKSVHGRDVGRAGIGGVSVE